jgi:integrase/recombinase XerC
MSDLIDTHLDWLGASASPYTVRDRRSILRRVDRKLPFGLEQALAAEIQKWLAGPKPPAKPWSAKTRHVYWQHLTAFYLWACDPLTVDDELDLNPMLGVRRPPNPRSLPRPVTADQLALMLTARRPYRTYVMLAALAGLRCIEISRLQREDVTEKTITIYGKGNKPAVLGTHPLLWAEIEPLPPGPIALLASGQQASPQAVSSRTSEYLRRIGVPPGRTLHGARHWYATTLLEGDDEHPGADLRTVQEALRHASLTSTQIYTEVTNARRDAAITGIKLPGQRAGRETQPKEQPQ